MESRLTGMSIERKVLSRAVYFWYYMMIYTIIVLLFTKNGLQSKDKYVATSSGRWDYSETENYIILLLDDFDSRALDDLLVGESECEVRAELNWYYMNIGVSSHRRLLEYI